MPELPEVETIRRGLAPVLVGRRMARGTVRRRDLRRPIVPDFARRLEGRRVLALDRRSKDLIVHIQGGHSCILHLGMSVRLKWSAGTRPPFEPHDHVEFEIAADRTSKRGFLRFCDPRRFGLMALTKTTGLAGHPLLAGLGVEPLDEGFTGAKLGSLVAGRKTTVKSALMDQRIVAGLGNIYVCESLFWAGISPKRMARTIGGRRAQRLAPTIRRVLEDAIASGGASLRDHRQPSGELGYFQHRFAVYGRVGERCPGCMCVVAKTGGIRRIVQGGRATFYCSTKQR